MSVHYDVEPIPQNYSSTCWLACLWMLHDYVNRPRSEVKDKIQQYKRTENVPDEEPPLIDYEYMCVHGIGKRDLTHVARSLTMLYGGEFSKPVSIEAVISTLKQRGPMMCCGTFNGGAHAILVVGARDAKVPMVQYIDPWMQFGGNEMEKPLSWWYKGLWKDAMGAVMYWPKSK